MSRKLLITALATGIGLDWLILREMEGNTVYSYSVADFVKLDVRDKRARVTGTLVPGTLCRMDDCGYRFTLTGPYGSYAGAACHELEATDVWTRFYEGAVPPLPLPPRCTELSPRM